MAMQINVTTTGTVPTVTLEELGVVLTHPQTIDLIADGLGATDAIDAEDLEAAIVAGQVVVTNEDGNAIPTLSVGKTIHQAFSLADDQTATEVSVNPSGSLVATNVQAALEELQGEIDAFVDTDDQTASEVPFTPTPVITSTDVQSALVEVEGKIPTVEKEFLRNTAVSVNDTNLNSTYLSLVTGALEGGEYKIDINYIWSLDSTQRDFIADVFVDNVLVATHRVEPKDAAGRDGGTGSGTNQRIPAHWMDVVNLAAGSHTIELRFRGQNNNLGATIYSGAVALENF